MAVSIETVNVLRLFSSTSTFFYLLIPAITLWYIYFRISRKRLYELMSKIDGPPGLPLVGNALEFIGDPHTTFKLLYERSFEFEFGKPLKIWIGPRVIVFLTDPRDIEVILGSHVHIDKSPDYRLFEPWLGDGLLISTGEKWRAHRKLIAPTFHLNVLKSFISIFNKNSRAIVEKMRKLGNQEFDVHEYMGEATVEILLETAMGVDKKTQDREASEYVLSVMKMCDILHLRHRQIWFRPEVIFQFTKYAKAQERFLNIIHGLTNKVLQVKKTEYEKKKKLLLENEPDFKIEDKTENLKSEKAEVKIDEVKSNMPEEPVIGHSYGQAAGLKDDLDVDDDIGEKKRQAFLDLLIESAENGVVLTDKEVREQVDTIMFEGHDTTAAGSSFFLCLMGTRPDIQEKVVEELNTIFKGSDRPCTFQDTLEMKYLERCLMETLRLYPPVPMIARQIKEEVVLPSTNAILPADTTIIIGTFKLHRNPEIYPNPNEFNPDNFLPEKSANRHYYSYVPFSAGPRSCVGRKYAVLKLKILLSTILRNFQIRTVKDQNDWQLQADIILKRTDGFRIILDPRKKAKVAI
uniref:Cytochrome P450 4G219 n=2 Tax=Maconellicoccus hirsutus TaxID=177089 RepID=A0AAT9UTD0_MACHI